MKPFALALVALALLPSAAGAAPVSVGAELYPSRGEQSRYYHAGNAQIVIHGDTSYVEVTAVQEGRGWTWKFQAPPGETLAPGVYERTASLHSGLPGRAGMSSANCMETGRFEVKDIAFNTDGTPSRLWVLYDEHCENRPDGAFGEVRFAEPLGDDLPVITPSVMRWSEGDVGRVTTAMPVTLIAPAGGLKVASAARTGSSDYAVTQDDCSGATVAAGAACRIWIRFSPSAPGTRTGTLRITETSGRAHDVPLEGWVHGGTTRLVMQSEPGDWIGGGESFSFGPADIYAGTTSEEFGFGTPQIDPPWNGRFIPRKGAPFAAGRYVMADKGAPVDGNYFNVWGRAHSCAHGGEYTVRNLVTTDGLPRQATVDFIQRCSDNNPSGATLRGTFEWRVGDNAQPAPWMVGGARTAEQPQTGASTSPEPGGPVQAPGAGVPAPGTVTCAGRAFAASAVRNGTPKGDRVRGTKAAEAIMAGAGSDRVSAGRGGDCVDGGAGNDRIDGGGGNDTLLGGTGRDVITAGPGRDVIDCGAGRDTARLGPGDKSKRCERRIRVRR